MPTSRNTNTKQQRLLHLRFSKVFYCHKILTGVYAAVQAIYKGAIDFFHASETEVKTSEKNLFVKTGKYKWFEVLVFFG